MTMVSGAAKAVPGAFFVERKRLVAAEEEALFRQGLKKRHSGAPWQVMSGGKKERFYKSL